MRRLALLAVVLPACGTTDWMGDPSGPGARWTASLGWVLFITFVAIVLAVWAVIAWAFARRRRGSLAEHMPWNTGGGLGWILIGGIAAPFIVFFGFYIASLVVMQAVPVEGRQHHRHEPARADLTLIGHQWWWELRYASGGATFTTANEIHIPAGRPFRILLESSDVIHSFWVPELHGKVDVIPGRENMIEIEADVPGRYDGQCAEYCGAQHAMMRLTVVAQTPAEYARWLFTQSQPALHPQHEPEIKGEELFEVRACGLCHTVRGTRALGSVGPDLTHVASRAMIGANSIPNQHAYVAGWIVRAQSLKPQIEMPNLSQLTGDDETALVAYLRSLR